MRSVDAKATVQRLTGRTPVNLRHLGDDQRFTVQLDDGSSVFAKTAPDTMPGALIAEAASLNWLAEAGAVTVPKVYGHTDEMLVIDHVKATSPTQGAAEEFGRELARLHAAGADAHGVAPPGGPADAWIGLAPMRNEAATAWPAFYAEHRIEPYLRRGRDAGVLSGDQVAVISEVRDRIDALAGPAEVPARLHGDLWSGNVLWADRVWLIDPAAHGGHRETDLAMLRLFGCPHLERVLAAYQEISPLADGWRDRIGLHQLFPLLVHAVLFGHGYAAQATAAARSALTS